VRFDVAKLLHEQLALLGNSPEVTPAHQLEVDLPSTPTELYADPDQISQVFWNVARNALKAMAGGGKLTVSGAMDEEEFRLVFRDTGSGMSVEARTELFQPFSSFFDDGVGIGMAIVYRIVEDHGGDIQVNSELREGSTITIRLPRGRPRDAANRELRGETP
jgi:two-component system sensor histidine kinase PilS (NtrC family)